MNQKRPEIFEGFLPWEFLQYIGQKSFKFFGSFLVQMKTLKFAFEIYWPLGMNHWKAQLKRAHFLFLQNDSLCYFTDLDHPWLVAFCLQNLQVHIFLNHIIGNISTIKMAQNWTCILTKWKKSLFQTLQRVFLTVIK